MRRGKRYVALEGEGCAFDGGGSLVFTFGVCV